MNQNDNAKGTKGTTLGFQPAALAVNLNQELEFEPPGQDHLAPENRLVYELKPPTKRVLEEVQNEEISFRLSENTDAHRGLVHSGTTRRLLVTNCLAGWRNLYRQVGRDEAGELLFEEVRYLQPGAPGTAQFRDVMAANYEQIPDSHVAGIVTRLKEVGNLTEVVEKKPATTSAGSTG